MKLRELVKFVNPEAKLILSHSIYGTGIMVTISNIEDRELSRRLLDCDIKSFDTAYVVDGVPWVLVNLTGQVEISNAEKVMRRKAKRIKRAADRLKWMKNELINNPEFVNLPIYDSILSQINTLQDYLVNNDAVENVFNRDDYMEGRL